LSQPFLIRPVLALERLSFLEPEGKIGYRYGHTCNKNNKGKAEGRRGKGGEPGATGAGRLNIWTQFKNIPGKSKRGRGGKAGSHLGA